MHIWQWTGAVFVGVLVVYGAWCYNRLVFNRLRVAEAWSGIDVQLKRRSSLVPSLVLALRAYMSHERNALESLAEKRSVVQRDEHAGAGRRGVVETELGNALAHVFVAAEAYPQLRADNNFLDLQRSLTELENQIQMSRRYYNGAVRELNVMVQSVPSNVVARIFKFRAAEYFAVADARERENPKLEFPT